MVNFLVAVMLTLCMVSGVLLRYAPFASIIDRKKKQLLFSVYTVMCALNILVIYLSMESTGILFAFNYLRFGGIIFAVVMLLINIIFIPGRSREHLFAFGIVLNCNYILMTIPNFFVAMFAVSSVVENLFIVLGIFLLLLVLTYLPLRKLLCNTIEPFLHLNIKGYWKTVWLIPVAYFVATHLTLGGEHNTGGWVQIVGSVLAGVIMVLVCLSVTSAHGRLYEKQAMEIQLNTQKAHYAELQVRVENARKTRHDFKHHIAVIRHYMDIDDKEGLRRYCDDWVIQNDEPGRIPYTGNAAADGVLYQYIQLAEKEQIEFCYTGAIHSQGIADLDLCALLGNALDNAFNACINVSDRKVSMICQSEKHLLSIIIRNSFDGKIIQDDNRILSRKQKNRQGVGLTSMEAICKRYEGNLDVSWDNKTFTVMIMLPLKIEE